MQQLILGVLVQLDDKLRLKIHLLVYAEQRCLLSRGCLTMAFHLPWGMSDDELGFLQPAAAAEFGAFGLSSFPCRLKCVCWPTPPFLANSACPSPPVPQMSVQNFFLQCSSLAREGLSPTRAGQQLPSDLQLPFPGWKSSLQLWSLERFALVLRPQGWC